MFAILTVTRDAFEYATQKRLSGAFLSIDQAKAFDRVRHTYLLQVMREFGFPASFVDLVGLLYRNLTCQVVVNGAASTSFNYTRGIRQGCPLGPTFFIMSLEPLLTIRTEDVNIRGFPLTGKEEVNVLGYADDVSLFLRDASSLNRFCYVFNRYADVSRAKINEGKSRALPFGSFPKEALGTIATVDAVKVLGVYFSRSGVAECTWQRALERAQAVTDGVKSFDLTLQEKALAVKARVCAFANYVSRIATMPSKTANQMNKLIGDLLWDGQPAPVRRILLRLPVNKGGLGLPHVLTTSKVLPLKTARQLHQAGDYLGKNLLRYWCSTHTKFLEAERHTCPLAESPSAFYKTAANTWRMLETKAPECDIDQDPPVRIVECVTRRQLPEEDKRKAEAWKKSKAKQSRGLPKEVQDFEWRRNWDVLSSRERLHRFGVVPSARCPNCRADESTEHALFECPAAKPVWRLTAKDFKIRPPP
ncbi:hypothetical protein HPB52_023358 [Rhipicephalus sanguineus]|uniref:Reverse transcriptase domain-containing protein n=1 Tax=Rhipicephalus sanguineus TaxID=34632 RepID=A0A9D4T6G0_RHISA|nr:hypothetical protein HPB52_023358 [Rhipicephalus sanguineus]